MAGEDHDILIRIDERTNETNKHVSTMAIELAKLNGRVRRLESWRSWLTGAVVGVGLVVGYLAKLVF